jgi:hypothetical protein
MKWRKQCLQARWSPIRKMSKVESSRGQIEIDDASITRRQCLLETALDM